MCDRVTGFVGTGAYTWKYADLSITPTRSLLRAWRLCASSLHRTLCAIRSIRLIGCIWVVVFDVIAMRCNRQTEDC